MDLHCFTESVAHILSLRVRFPNFLSAFSPSHFLSNLSELGHLEAVQSHRRGPLGQLDWRDVTRKFLYLLAIVGNALNTLNELLDACSAFGIFLCIFSKASVGRKHSQAACNPCTWIFLAIAKWIILACRLLLQALLAFDMTRTLR